MPNPELDAEALYQRLVERVRNGLAGVGDVAIAGIYSGGAWVAERLAADLKVQQPLGYIDVSFYRDDYAEKGLPAEVKPTSVPFNVEGATILLVDDVLYTGRTARAALDALMDMGRPASVHFLAFIDRGLRELPIFADIVGRQVPTMPGEEVRVRLEECDGKEGVWLVERLADEA